MTKRRTTSMHSISTAFIRKFYGSRSGHGTMLVNGKGICALFVSRDSVRISYTLTERNGEKTDIDTEVACEWTPCNYGGSRRWFICPSCQERVGVLFMGKGIACRRCWRMTYPCQQDRSERGWAMYYRLLDKMGGIDGGKPLRMRWATYERLQAKANRIAGRNLIPLLGRLQKYGKA